MSIIHAPFIQFVFNAPIRLEGRKALKKFLAERLLFHGVNTDRIHFIFVSDPEILEINGQYLNHHYYTDIITFDYRDAPELPLVSDIYISVDTVRSNAVLHQTTIKQELHRVIFHGVLHLIGFDDKQPAAALEMRAMEDQWLALYGV